MPDPLHDLPFQKTELEAEELIVHLNLDIDKTYRSSAIESLDLAGLRKLGQKRDYSVNERGVPVALSGALKGFPKTCCITLESFWIRENESDEDLKKRDITVLHAADPIPHYFKASALASWVGLNPICPKCKKPLTDSEKQGLPPNTSPLQEDESADLASDAAIVNYVLEMADAWSLNTVD